MPNSFAVNVIGVPATRTSNRAVSTSTSPILSTTGSAAGSAVERRSSARARATSSLGL